MTDNSNDPILDEIERKLAIGEIRTAMEGREFWELTEHAVAYEGTPKTGSLWM